MSVRVCRHRLPSRGTLQKCVAVLQCSSALQCVAGRRSVWQCSTVCGSVWQCDTRCCGVLQGAASFAVCCSVLQSIVIIALVEGGVANILNTFQSNMYNLPPLHSHQIPTKCLYNICNVITLKHSRQRLKMIGLFGRKRPNDLLYFSRQIYSI